VRATEGYTVGLHGERRTLAPINSSMIVTEPLPDETWRAIGWEGGELLGDNAHVYVYLQRTLDGRIAIGGRGAPYRFGSRTDGRGETAASTVRSLRAALAAMFPAAAGARLDHAWSGVLGVPRDWCPSVAAEASTGLARAGGYVGEGVAASNLAARTLRDLMLGRRTELTELPWVDRRPRRWEPEPLRWAEIQAVYWLYRRADAAERRSGRPSRVAAVLDRLSGRA
jgi:glycine/D-amino acid oxidase-like deaminating enzyme